MKLHLFVAVGLAAAGCSTPDPGLEQKRPLNTWLYNSLKNASAENAIIRQHTLYPYHFIHDAAGLNDLGQADLAVLASHYNQQAGTLNVHKGDASTDLYAARKKAVLQELALAGVKADRVVIADGLPGGDGADAERVILSLMEPGEKGDAATTTREGGDAGKNAGKTTPTMKTK